MRKVLWLVLLAGCPDPAGAPVDEPSDDPGAGLEFRTLGFTDEGFFFGRWQSAYGEGLKPIARGGVAWVRVNGLPFDDGVQDIDATASGPLSIASIDRRAAFVHVRGEAAGTGELRVTQASDATVHDRTAMDAHEVRALGLFPSTFPPGHAELAEEDYPFASWALVAGAQRAVTVGLLDDAGNRLVDHEMRVEVTSGDAIVRPAPFTPVWDMLVFDKATAGTVGVRATLASGEAWDASIDVVERADRIAGASWNESWYPQLRAGAPSIILCFGAYAGEASRVLGATWSYAVSDNLALGESGSPNCPRVQPLAAGAAGLVVTAAGATLEVPLTVLP